MSFSNKDISSFIDSDEVSEIDGIRLTKSYSVSRLEPAREREFSRTASVKAFNKAALMIPDINAVKLSKQRMMSRDRSEDDASESMDDSVQRKSRHAKKAAISNLTEESETQSVGGTIRKRKSRRKKPSLDSRLYKTDIGRAINELSEQSESSSTILKVLKPIKESNPSSKSTTSSSKSKSKSEIPTKPHSREEIKQMTNGFIVVPKKDWGNLEPGSCIKWINNNGRCVTREWYYWYHKKSDKNDKPFFYVGMYPNKSDAPWQLTRSVFWENIKCIYKKEDPITKLLKQAIDKRQDHIADIAHFLKLKYGDEFEIYMRTREAHRMRLEIEKDRAEEKAAEEKQKLEQAAKLAAKEEKARKTKEAKEANPKVSKVSKISKISKISKVKKTTEEKLEKPSIKKSILKPRSKSSK